VKTGWNNTEWRQVKQRLAGICPAPDESEIVIRRVKMGPDEFGDTERVEVPPEEGFEDAPPEYRYVIRINSALPTDFAVWVLVHEWAHVMVWPIYGERDADHGPYWGIAYGKAYQAAYPTNQ
jgi:hypothetical protein